MSTAELRLNGTTIISESGGTATLQNTALDAGVTIPSNLNIDNALANASFPDGHWVPLGLVQGNSSDNTMIFDNVFSDDYLYFKIYFHIMPSTITPSGDLYFRYRVNGTDLATSNYYGRTVFDGYGGTASAAISGLTYYNLWAVGMWGVTNRPIINGEFIFSQVSNPVVNGSTRFGSYYRPYGIGSCFGYGTDASTGYGRSDSNIRYNGDLDSNSLPDGFVIYTETTTDRLSTNSYVYAWGMKP